MVIVSVILWMDLHIFMITVNTVTQAKHPWGKNSWDISALDKEHKLGG